MNQRKGAGTFIRVLIILILVVLIGGVLAFNFFFKTDGTPSNIFGLYFLRTNEIYMETEIMPGDMVIALKTEPSELQADDVVICQFDERVTIIRIVAVEPAEGINPVGFWVKYDTVDDSKAFKIDESKIVARAEYKDPVMGQLLTAATSIPGIIVAVIIPLTIIIIYQITRFAKERSDYTEEDYEELPDKPGETPEARTERRFRERTEDLTEMLAERNLDEPVKLSSLKTTDRTLSVNEQGRAELSKFADTKTRQIAVTAYPKAPEGPRFQSRIGFPEKETPAVPVMLIPPETNDKPPVTRIDDLIRDKAPLDDRAKDFLRPKPASVIPDEITKLQQSTVSKPSAFDESVREYYQAPTKQEQARQEQAKPETFLEPTIPDGAVVPKEKITPVRRKKPSSTVDELMKMIDDQSSKRR
ncbi:MAG: hypothetical protein LBM41_06970 [Ruminococcus sp.]|nr:hypothetical protein [Ruminococcus sp.]